MTSPLSRISAGSFFSGCDLRIFVVGLAGHHGRRHEFDFVDQPELDRGNAHLAGEGRGGGEGEFHMDILGDGAPWLTARHCERSEAIHGRRKGKDWIASSLALLAMTQWTVDGTVTPR